MVDSKTLLEVPRLLNYFGVNVIIFGGWAEELTGIIEPRVHKDIDLLYHAANFDLVDKLLQRNLELIEIKQKHFYHKRAFIYKNVMIEIFLVEKDTYGNFTNFWGNTKHYWPKPISIKKNKFEITTPKVLESYRNNYDKLKYI